MEPNAPSPPASIGRFRIDSVLGSGGMGAVYKAFDPTLQRTVALKTVRPDINRQDYLDRLYREAQACARLKHPNVVTVYEAGEVDGLVYMVMEYLEGQDLARVLHGGKLTFATKAKILIQILDALEHAHGQDVIHRDIKPSNVYRQPDGSIKVVDFGLARVLQADAMTTASGVMMGTAHYASPEQLKGSRNVDRRTDIYSTGVLAYEMFSGRRPFETEDGSVMSVMLKAINEPPPPIDIALAKSFPQIERFVMRAMAKSPDDRYQTAGEMRDDLQRFLANSGEAVRQAELRLAGGDSMTDHESTLLMTPSLDSPRAARRGRAWLAAAAAAVVLIGVAIVSLTRSGSSPVVPADAQPAAGAASTPAPAPPAADTTAAAPSAPSLPPPAPTQIRTATPPARVTSNPGPAGTVAADAGATAPGPSPSGPTPSAAPSGAEDPSARQLFVSNTGSVAGLRYRLLRQAPDGVETEIDPSQVTFKNGDRVRFTFESNIDGYLYVVQQGSSGKWTMLFPHPDINAGQNSIRKGLEYKVPSATEGWFKFSGPPGTEQVFVFLSREPVDRLPGFNGPVRAYETVEASVVQGLQGRIQSRDLVFEKDRGRAYVVNKTEVGKAVTASFPLVHVQ